jgi:membrane protein required for colicin V production
MVDFILGIALAALAVRGWFRGWVKESFDLIGLVVGIWVAFRLSAPLGDFLADGFGVTPEAARIGAGILLFLLFGVAMAVAANYLTKLMKLPGLNLANRIGGAMVALGWGVVLLLVLVNVFRVLPVANALDLEDSMVVQVVAGPEAFPQRTFERFAGDSALLALQNIQRLFGVSRLVPEGDEIIEIPPAEADEIRQVRGEADRVLAEINRMRTGDGLGALQASDGLRAIAESRASDSYISGELQRSQDGCVAAAREVGGVNLANCSDLLALASTALGAFDGIAASEDGGRVLSSGSIDRAGVSVIDGPTGRLLVIVVGG